MWHLRIKGGVEISEEQMRYWDNIPKDVEVESLALVFQRSGAKPFVVDCRGYEAYCCARVASAGAGGHSMPAGYALSMRKGGLVSEIVFLPDGMQVREYPIEQSDLPERCWRRGKA